MRSVTDLPILNAAQRQSFDALLSPLPTVSLEQVNQRARMMSRMDRKYVLSSDQCAGILAQLPDETPVMSIGGAQSFISAHLDSSVTGDAVTIEDSSGTVIATIEAGDKPFALVQYSSDKISAGQSYTVKAGASSVSVVAGSRAESSAPTRR